MEKLSVKTGGYWHSILKSGFYSDVVNDQTGKFITYVSSSLSTEKIDDFLLFCAEHLSKNNMFHGGKYATVENPRHTVPLLFYGYTDKKDELKQKLKELKKAVSEHPEYKQWMDERKINMSFYWKLDSLTYKEVKTNTHYSQKNRTKIENELQKKGTISALLKQKMK